MSASYSTVLCLVSRSSRFVTSLLAPPFVDDLVRDVEVDSGTADDTFMVEEKAVLVTANPKLADTDWSGLGVDIVCDCTVSSPAHWQFEDVFNLSIVAGTVVILKHGSMAGFRASETVHNSLVYSDSSFRMFSSGLPLCGGPYSHFACILVVVALRVPMPPDELRSAPSVRRSTHRSTLTSVGS